MPKKTVNNYITNYYASPFSDPSNPFTDEEMHLLHGLVQHVAKSDLAYDLLAKFDSMGYDGDDWIKIIPSAVEIQVLD